MKKIIAGIIIITLAIGGYFAYTKGEKALFAKVDQFVEKNINKPYHLSIFESSHLIDKATITLTDYQQTSAKSVLDISGLDLITGDLISYSIPLKTMITRGLSKNGDETFKVASAMTTVDVANMKNVPSFIKENTFTIQHFLGLTGKLREVYTINNISYSDSDGSSLVFDGASLNIDSNLLSRSKFDILAKFKPLQIADKSGNFEVKPFEYNAVINKNGEFSGSSSVLNVKLNEGEVKIENIKYSGSIDKFNNKKNKNSNSTSAFGVFNSNSNISINDISIKGRLIPAEIKIDKITAIGGLYKQNDKHSNIKYQINILPNAESAKNLNSPIIPQNIDINYQLNNIPNKVIAFLESNSPMEFDKDGKISKIHEERFRQAIGTLHKSKSELIFTSNITTDKGLANVDFKVEFDKSTNKMTKKQFINAVMIPSKDPTIFLKLIATKLYIEVDKEITEAAGVTMMVEMFGADYVTSSADNKKFIIDAVTKDGEMIINGNKQTIPFR